MDRRRAPRSDESLKNMYIAADYTLGLLHDKA
jgi:hypothetical protein